MREIWRPSLIGSKYQKLIRISGGEWFRDREWEKKRLAKEIRNVIGEAK
jgi:ribosomal protein S6